MAKEMKNAVLLISAVSIIFKTSGYETSRMRRTKRPDSPLIIDESLYYEVRPDALLLGRRTTYEVGGSDILAVRKGTPEANPTTNLIMISSENKEYPESYYPDTFLYLKSGPKRLVNPSSPHTLIYKDTNSKIYEVNGLASQPVFEFIDEEEIYFRKISNGELISVIVQRTFPEYLPYFAIHLKSKVEGKSFVDSEGKISHVEIKLSPSSENGKTNLYFPPGANSGMEDNEKGYVTDWFLHRKQGAEHQSFPFFPPHLSRSKFVYVTPSLRLLPVVIKRAVLTDARKTQYMDFVRYSNRDLIQIRLRPRISENG